MQGVLNRRQGDIHRRAIDQCHARPEYGRRQRQSLASLRQCCVKSRCRPDKVGFAGRLYETNHWELEKRGYRSSVRLACTVGNRRFRPFRRGRLFGVVGRSGRMPTQADVGFWYFQARTKYLQLADKAARTVIMLTKRLDRHRGRG